jgi:putative tryptophan/tyrosine transport system substrate-binding protein
LRACARERRLAHRSDHIPVIGVLLPGGQDSFGQYLGALRKGLEELQYFEGRDFVFELRWGEDVLERLPILAADLVNRKVDVIVVASRPATVAACGRRFVLAEVGIIATRP